MLPVNLPKILRFGETTPGIGALIVERQRTRPAATTTTETLLVVDDDETIRELVAATRREVAKCSAPQPFPEQLRSSEVRRPRRVRLSAAMHGVTQGEPNSPDGKPAQMLGNVPVREP
jgi:hypothetical protein